MPNKIVTKLIELRSFTNFAYNCTSLHTSNVTQCLLWYLKMKDISSNYQVGWT